MDETDDPPPPSLWVRDGERVTATAHSTSPWGTDSLHGGPVAALLARELCDLPAPAPMFPARLTLELLRPVGFVPYRVTTRVVRPGRQVQVLEALMTEAGGEDDRPVARATLQQIGCAPTPLPTDLAERNGPPDRTIGPPEAHPRIDGSLGLAAVDDGTRFHRNAVEHRGSTEFLQEPGPATDWIRVVADLFPGDPLRPFERLAAAADFGNGLSSALPFDRYRFINPDLTVHLFRLPVDDWVCLDAVTRFDPSPDAGSVGLAESALFDRRGRIGRSLQSLLITNVR